MTSKLSIVDIAYLLKIGNIESLKRNLLKKGIIEFNISQIPIDTVKYVRPPGKYKAIKGEAVKKLERAFFSQPLLKLFELNDDWTSVVETVRNYDIGYKPFCQYLSMLYRGHKETGRPSKLVELKYIKKGERVKEDHISLMLWLIATTGESRLYTRRKRRWLSYILFRPNWNRIKTLNRKTVKLTLSRDYKKLKSTNQGYNKEPQIIVLNDILNLIISSRK